jgi:hypothetical protein
MQQTIATSPFALAALALLLLTACSPTPTREPQVSVKAPLQRLDMPEQPARRMSAGVNVAPRMASAVLADDQRTTTPDAQRPRFDDGDSYGSVQFEGYPLERLGLGVEIRGEESDEVLDAVRVRGKLHLIDTGIGRRAQAGQVSLAVTGAYGQRSYDYLINREESDGFFGGYLVSEAHTVIRSNERDFALVAGYRPAAGLLLFGGPFIYRQPYAGSHTDYEPPEDSGAPGEGDDMLGELLGGGGDDGGSSSDAEPVTTEFSGKVGINGVNAGVAITLGVPELRLIAEVAHARIEAGQQTGDMTGVSLAFQGDFGPRTD